MLVIEELNRDSHFDKNRQAHSILERVGMHQVYRLCLTATPICDSFWVSPSEVDMAAMEEAIANSEKWKWGANKTTVASSRKVDAASMCA